MSLNTISVGSTYRAKWAHSGQNPRGAYEMVKVVNDKDKEDITIFTNNCPTGITTNDRFVINKITAVTRKWRKGNVWNAQKKEKEEGWIQEVEVNAEISRLDDELGGISGDLPDEFGDFGSARAPWDDLPDDDQLPL